MNIAAHHSEILTHASFRPIWARVYIVGEVVVLATVFISEHVINQ